MRLPLLILHISAGTLGIRSGFVAMSFRKGSSPHRAAGNVFFISMLSLSASGALPGVNETPNEQCFRRQF